LLSLSHTHTHTLRTILAHTQSHLNTVGAATAAPPGISALSLLSSGLGALLKQPGAAAGPLNLGASGAGLGRAIGLGAPVGPTLPAGAVIKNLDVLKQQPPPAG
jgi:hypothetical protein